MSIPKSIKTTDIEIDDLRKRTQEPTLLAGKQATEAVQHQKMQCPDIKKQGMMGHLLESFKNGQNQQRKMKQ